jgi:hypothetical protein
MPGTGGVPGAPAGTGTAGAPPRTGIGPAYPVHPSSHLTPAGAPVPYRRTPRWPVWVAALIVALLVAAGAVTLIKVRHGSNSSDGRPRPAPSDQGAPAGPNQPGARQPGPTQPGQLSTPAGAPTSGGVPADTVAPPADSDRDDGFVLVTPSDYIGQSQEIVVRQLASLGLLTHVEDAAEGSAGPAGTVAKLYPTGKVRRHTLITVFAVRADRSRNR